MSTCFVITFDDTDWEWNGEEEEPVTVTRVAGVLLSEDAAKAYCAKHGVAFNYEEVPILEEP